MEQIQQSFYHKKRKMLRLILLQKGGQEFVSMSVVLLSGHMEVLWKTAWASYIKIGEGQVPIFTVLGWNHPYAFHRIYTNYKKNILARFIHSFTIASPRATKTDSREEDDATFNDESATPWSQYRKLFSIFKLKISTLPLPSSKRFNQNLVSRYAPLSLTSPKYLVGSSAKNFSEFELEPERPRPHRESTSRPRDKQSDIPDWVLGLSRGSTWAARCVSTSFLWGHWAHWTVPSIAWGRWAGQGSGLRGVGTAALAAGRGRRPCGRRGWARWGPEPAWLERWSRWMRNSFRWGRCGPAARRQAPVMLGCKLRRGLKDRESGWSRSHDRFDENPPRFPLLK